LSFAISSRSTFPKVLVREVSFMQDFIDKVVETIRRIPQEQLEEVRSGRAVLNLRISGTDVESEVVSIRQCLDRAVKRLQLVVDELRELQYQLEDP